MSYIIPIGIAAILTVWAAISISRLGNHPEDTDQT